MSSRQEKLFILNISYIDKSILEPWMNNEDNVKIEIILIEWMFKLQDWIFNKLSDLIHNILC